MTPHRFSAWDGTQDPLGPDTDEIFDRLSEDVYQGWDFDGALRRLLSQGWRDREGRWTPGLEEMTEELRRLRQRHLEHHSLDGVFTDIEEKLDRVLRLERQGIDERLSSAPEGPVRRVLERVAEDRRRQLDELPLRPAGAIRQLQEYEFMDHRAEQAFQELMAELKRAVVETHIRQISSQLSSLSPEDVSRLQDVLHDLDALIRQKLEGASEARLQAGYTAFLERWGSMFPDAPPTLDEFLEQMERRMARMDSLMRSLSPAQRRQLEELAAGVLGDGELMDAMAQLSASLERLPSRGHLGRRYVFYGDDQVSLEGAVRLIDELQFLEELEQALRGVYDGRPIGEIAAGALSEILGEERMRDLGAMQRITEQLESHRLVERGEGGLRLTARGMRRIGQKALDDLFSQMERDRFGDHALAREGRSGERSDHSKPYEFGDTFDLDVQQTVMNAIRREAGEQRSVRPPRLRASDFHVHGTETLTRSATVLMLDMSRSMPLRGYFYAAKKVALALDALIRTQYPRDTLHIVGFARCGQEISPAALPQLSVDEYVYGTNLQHALMVARRLLSRHKGGNRQVIVVTDGEPTAHNTDTGEFIFQYPPLPETIQRTLVEVRRCTREGIRINTFMLESNHRLVDFVTRMTRINRGRAFFISPDRLGDYILLDYVRGRQRAA